MTHFAFVKSGLENNNGSLIIIRGEDLYKNTDNPDIEKLDKHYQISF